MKKQQKPKLSIVILNRNTKELLSQCLRSLGKVKKEVGSEIIVVDNGSTDGSTELVKEQFGNVKLIESSSNLGFAKGNNLAKTIVRGEYILFLNSDTVVYKNTLTSTIKYLDENIDTGALTCKIVLQDGKLDKDARRSFINPWNSLIHLYLKLDRLFPTSRLFGTYWYGYVPENTTHEVDVIQGAYFLTRRKVLDEVGWFDEDYFLDGEDIDLCWRIKKAGWKIIYYPESKILHIKGATKGKNTNYLKKVPLGEKLKYRLAGVNSMELFFKKRLWERYPIGLNMIIISGIYLLKVIRTLKTYLVG